MGITSSKGQRSWWSLAVVCPFGVDGPVAVLTNCGPSVPLCPTRVACEVCTFHAGYDAECARGLGLRADGVTYLVLSIVS